jgi:hypothetical protein
MSPRCTFLSTIIFVCLYMDTQKTGSKFALLIGLPTGLAFFLMAISLSHFYAFAFLLRISSLRIFWNPLTWVVIALTLSVALWHDGKMISKSLTKRDILRTSFYFTFKVNLRLLVIMASIYFIGMISDVALETREVFFAAIPYAILIMIVFFAFATLLLSVSVSLAIVQLTKIKIEGIKNNTIAAVEPLKVDNSEQSL